MRFVRQHKRGVLAILIVSLLVTATWAVDTKLTALGVLGSADVGDDDAIYIVDEPNGVATSYKIGRGEFLRTWAGSASITTVGALSGATLAGILADNDDMVFEADADNNGSNKYSWTDGASSEIASLTEAGVLYLASNLELGHASDTTISRTGAGAIAVEGVAVSLSTHDHALTYQPLESTLTDIADGTITEDLVNTANPWADNEVANGLSITVADTVDATCFVGLWESATGDLAPKTDAGLTYAADTGTLSATVLMEGPTGVPNLSDKLSVFAATTVAELNGVLSDENAGTDLTADLEEEAHTAEHAVGGADTVFPADPGADRYLMWDDDPGALVWSEGAGAATAWDAIANPSGAGEVDFGNTTQELAIGVSGAFQIGDGGGANYVQFSSTGAVSFAGTASIDVPAKSIAAADLADTDFGAFTVADGVAALDVDYEEEVTEGSLADSVIVSADIKDGTIAEGDLAGNIAITSTGSQDFGGAAGFEIPNGTNPTVDAAGEIAQDTDGANETGDVSVRAFDGTNTFMVERKLKTIQFTVVLPQDLADATRDCLPVWSNNTGMIFTVTEIMAWSDTDDTTVTVEIVTATDFSAPATLDALEIATDGTSVFTCTETTITDATVAHDEIITLDFDDTDAPGWVKVSITGWFNAAVD